MVLPLAKSSSDHVPCVVNISTSIPKANIFRFESFWVSQPSFMEVVKDSWNKDSNKQTSAAIMADNFKSLRYALKKWHLTLSKLRILIQNCNKVILILDELEKMRPLYTTELISGKL